MLCLGNRPLFSLIKMVVKALGTCSLARYTVKDISHLFYDVVIVCGHGKKETFNLLSCLFQCWLFVADAMYAVTGWVMLRIIWAHMLSRGKKKHILSPDHSYTIPVYVQPIGGCSSQQLNRMAFSLLNDLKRSQVWIFFIYMTTVSKSLSLSSLWQLNKSWLQRFHLDFCYFFEDISVLVYWINHHVYNSDSHQLI